MFSSFSGFVRRGLASLSVMGLLVLSTGCQTGGREVAPGISRGAGHTFTTLAADVATATSAAETAMRSRGLVGVQAITSDKLGEVTGLWLDHTVKATVRQAGTRTARITVPHTAGHLLAQKLVEDVETLVYGDAASPADTSAKSARRRNPLVPQDTAGF